MLSSTGGLQLNPASSGGEREKMDQSKVTRGAELTGKHALTLRLPFLSDRRAKQNPKVFSTGEEVRGLPCTKLVWVLIGENWCYCLVLI